MLLQKLKNLFKKEQPKTELEKDREVTMHLLENYFGEKKSADESDAAFFGRMLKQEAIRKRHESKEDSHL